jgi:hypothetical protein
MLSKAWVWHHLCRKVLKMQIVDRVVHRKPEQVGDASRARVVPSWCWLHGEVVP